MSQFPFYTGGYAIPSMNTVLEGVENHPWFGKWEDQVWFPVSISGAARDAGNTDTTLLRPGLLLGKITSSGLLKEWNPTGTDGSEVLFGVLGGIVHAQQAGSNQQRYLGFVMVAGTLYSDKLVVPGTAAEGIVGHAQEFNIFNQLSPRFLLDQHLHLAANGYPGSKFRYLTAAEVTADAVTVTTAEHRRTFLMLGADGNTTFTLPAAKVGLEYTVIASVASHSAIVKAASGTFAIPGDVAVAAATGVTLAPGESATFLGYEAGKYALTNYTQVDTDT